MSPQVYSPRQILQLVLSPLLLFESWFHCRLPTHKQLMGDGSMTRMSEKKIGDSCLHCDFPETEGTRTPLTHASQIQHLLHFKAVQWLLITSSPQWRASTPPKEPGQLGNRMTAMETALLWNRLRGRSASHVLQTSNMFISTHLQSASPLAPAT